MNTILRMGRRKAGFRKVRKNNLSKQEVKIFKYNFRISIKKNFFKYFQSSSSNTDRRIAYENIVKENDCFIKYYQVCYVICF